MKPILNLVGKRFGRLKVEAFKESRYRGISYWCCLCDCGKKVEVNTSSLNSGHAKSCGCLNKELSAKRCVDRSLHNLRHTRFYNIWCHVIQRCTNSKNKDFKNYGERGIKICERWKTFLNFKNDLYNSYLEKSKEKGEKNISIDRIDNEKGYFLENIQWSTAKEQSNNRRNNKNYGDRMERKI